MIFRAQKFLFCDRRFLHRTKFSDGEIKNFTNGFFCSAGVNGEHSRVRIRRDFAEDGVSQTALFTDVLEETRGHSAAEKIVENSDAKTAFVRNRQRRHANAKVNLLEIFFA